MNNKKTGLVNRVLIVFLTSQCYLFAAINFLLTIPFFFAELLPRRLSMRIGKWTDRVFMASSEFWVDTAKRIRDVDNTPGEPYVPQDDETNLTGDVNVGNDE